MICCPVGDDSSGTANGTAPASKTHWGVTYCPSPVLTLITPNAVFLPCRLNCWMKSSISFQLNCPSLGSRTDLAQRVYPTLM